MRTQTVALGQLGFCPGLRDRVGRLRCPHLPELNACIPASLAVFTCKQHRGLFGFWHACWCGTRIAAGIVTLNAVLLKGKISFFQSVRGLVISTRSVACELISQWSAQVCVLGQCLRQPLEPPTQVAGCFWALKPQATASSRWS